MKKNPSNIFENGLKISLYISLVPLFVMPVLVAVDVVTRGILKAPIHDTVEITSFLLSMLISLALPYATYQKRNVVVTLIVNRLPVTARIVLDALTSFFAAGVIYLLSWQAAARGIYSLKVGEFVGAMCIPTYPSRFLFSLGCLLTALALTGQFLQAFRSKRNE